jgi:hypothetical protein
MYLFTSIFIILLVLRKDDQDLLDSDCNTALHIATLEKTGHKLKLNVIQELIGIRCSPHKKNSQNKLAIDNLTKEIQYTIYFTHISNLQC